MCYIITMNIIMAIAAGIGFGFAMFFRKMSVTSIGMAGVIFESVVEAVLSVILILMLFPINVPDIVSKQAGMIYGLAAGISATLGLIAYFLAAKLGPGSIPSIFTPVLSASTATILTLIILREPFSIIKLLGLFFSLVGLFIFIRF